MNVDWARVKGLFHSALEREPAERAAFLHASCGDEAAVRAEVERLLAAHDQAAGFIEHSPVAMTGRAIGHYQLERLIGTGGMGQVYLARDLDLGRTVAVKIALGSDVESQARLRREAQHASQLNHPNICTIHEVGAADGLSFIVMEFVEGQRLADLIPTQGLSVPDLQRYGMQIADALAHAHRHGVTHRDLKAANIVVTSDGRAKVLDFGLARRLSAESLKDLSQSQEPVTAEGTLAGTLACMAPEQFRGASADARTDVWALGVLLHEMATGTRPFTGATGFLLSAAILHEPPAPLPVKLPPSFRAVITRCLEKDPVARYQRADEVRLALADASTDVASASAASRRVQTKPPFLSRFSRHWQLGIASVVVIALVIASYALLRRDRAPAAVGASGRPAIAVLHFENAGSQDIAWMSEGIPSMLLTGLAQTRGLDVVSARRLREAASQQGVNDLASLDESAAAGVARRAGAGAVVMGSVYKADEQIRIDAQVEDLASGRILVAQSVRGTNVFALVDELAARIRDGVGLPADPAIRRVSDVSTSSVDAFRLYAQGSEAFANARGNDARIALEEAVRIDPEFAEAYLVLASVSGFSGQPGRRGEYLRKASEHANRLSEARRLLLNAQLAMDAGNVPEASRGLEELVAKYPETEAAYTTAGNFLGGDLRETEKFLRIMKVGVSALPNSTSMRNNYGYALLEAGLYGEGIREFERYVELAPREANPYDSLADGHLTSGSPDKAVQSYARALAIDPGFSGSRMGLSWSLAVSGRYDEALAAKPPLRSLEAYLVSRLGRYGDAAELLAAGKQQAELNQNPAEQSVYMLISAALDLEQRRYARALREVSAVENVVAAEPPIRRDRHRVLMQVLSGLAELGVGQADLARARLPLLRQLYRPVVAEEQLWYLALEGEIALATGDLDRASAAFAAGEPERRKPMRFRSGSLTILANSFPFRDGAARVAKARGDLQTAIRLYRRLLAYGPDSKFIGAVEPRYVLALGRLLEQAGDKQSALKEYERFLTLWKNADSNLPELGEARRAVVRLR